MTKTHSAPSKVLRDFIETTLVFGAPVEGASLSSIFSESAPRILHYAKSEHTIASINAVNEMQWDAMHSRQQEGMALYDLYTNGRERALEFLKKEVAKTGFAIDDILDPTQGKTLTVALNLIQGFEAEYRQKVDSDVKVCSTITLVKTEQGMNWDMIVRFALFGQKESMFFQFLLPKILQGKAFLIAVRQATAIVHLVKDFFASFEANGTVFDGPELPIGGRTSYVIPACKAVVHYVIHHRNITPQTLWTDYTTKAKAALVGTPHLFYKPAWNELSELQRSIFTTAVEIARAAIDTHISINAAQGMTDWDE